MSESIVQTLNQQKTDYIQAKNPISPVLKVITNVLHIHRYLKEVRVPHRVALLKNNQNYLNTEIAWNSYDVSERYIYASNICAFLSPPWYLKCWEIILYKWKYIMMYHQTVLLSISTCSGVWCTTLLPTVDHKKFKFSHNDTTEVLGTYFSPSCTHRVDHTGSQCHSNSH